jgi:hypothetical protein
VDLGLEAADVDLVLVDPGYLLGLLVSHAHSLIISRRA